MDLAGLLHGMADLVSPIAEERKLTLRREISGDLGVFDVDPDNIRDVVANLLSNAIKFTPDGRTIALEARLTEPDVAEIHVRDEGIGFEPAALENAFEAFYTEVDPSRHSSGDFGFQKRGMGLGLSLVRTFVERHGGRVSATSEPGGGTSVRVTIPRRPLPVAANHV